MNSTSAPDLLWRDHDSSGHSKRVWRPGWGGDTFEVLDFSEFEVLHALCQRLSIALVEADD